MVQGDTFYSRDILRRRLILQTKVQGVESARIRCEASHTGALYSLHFGNRLCSPDWPRQTGCATLGFERNLIAFIGHDRAASFL
jgi:hypothetical protein